MALIYKVDKENPDIEVLKKAAQVLEKGGLVAFPTETVYGLGADALNPEAVKKIFIAKGRPPDNPIIVHVGKKEQVYSLTENVPSIAEKLMEEFWPGPLTLIFYKSNLVDDVVTAGSPKVGIRQPMNKVALKLLEVFGKPIAAPSANVSGRPSPTKAEHVIEDLEDKIDIIIDGGDVNFGVESTVLDITTDTPIIYRPGACPKEEIERVIGKKVMVWNKEKSKEDVPSPGLKYRHYAPKVPLYIVEEFNEIWQNKINDWLKEGKKVGVLVSKENENLYSDKIKKYVIGSRKNLTEIALNLFFYLRKLEKEVDIIISESFPEEGLGLAVMDRLRRAAGEK
ncbi:MULTISPECIES: L-threonylcarbamoyladenylate synthase [Dictyoglomus]|jgi:L-threonylcarbamoyladenylate synthase|uniref:Threonylcarbamoyl-AMP synthase n=1 Tax=Dictyoglomus turgidum (strain DSM 6724 / Z-1310) TaxID=515635 RepID=B8E005_DICTD|nr:MULTISPECIES: L-threonylcarbamoyladenylate synthase [Dictyoglomus]ACK42088.1 Sua5/YciO/YrdC/YwlC family protein [Dictyoglomus turgidum DSM 6724]HBU32319.1 threonylcarbamoyl-AMP synthase [Dictyoglomus sp.]